MKPSKMIYKLLTFIPTKETKIPPNWSVSVHKCVISSKSKRNCFIYLFFLNPLTDNSCSLFPSLEGRKKGITVIIVIYFPPSTMNPHSNDGSCNSHISDDAPAAVKHCDAQWSAFCERWISNLFSVLSFLLHIQMYEQVRESVREKQKCFSFPGMSPDLSLHKQRQFLTGTPERLRPHQ